VVGIPHLFRSQQLPAKTGRQTLRQHRDAALAALAFAYHAGSAVEIEILGPPPQTFADPHVCVVAQLCKRYATCLSSFGGLAPGLPGMLKVLSVILAHKSI
jgi:hypothetical protein